MSSTRGCDEEVGIELTALFGFAFEKKNFSSGSYQKEDLFRIVVVVGSAESRREHGVSFRRVVFSRCVQLRIPSSRAQVFVQSPSPWPKIHCERYPPQEDEGSELVWDDGEGGRLCASQRRCFDFFIVVARTDRVFSIPSPTGLSHSSTSSHACLSRFFLSVLALLISETPLSKVTRRGDIRPLPSCLFSRLPSSRIREIVGSTLQSVSSIHHLSIKSSLK